MRLRADLKCYLTQQADVEVEKREFHESVYLRKAEDALKWRQVTEAEKAKLLAAGTVLGVANLDADYLTQVETLIGQIPQVINSKGLTASEALAHKEWYPYWGEEGAEMGKEVAAGFRLRFREEGEEEDSLYEVVQGHALQPDWKPGMGTASLYRKVDASHTGTQDDPIPYEQGMAITQGLYYTQGGKLYVGILTTATGYPNDLGELFTLVREVTE